MLLFSELSLKLEPLCFENIIAFGLASLLYQLYWFSNASIYDFPSCFRLDILKFCLELSHHLFQSLSSCLIVLNLVDLCVKLMSNPHAEQILNCLKLFQ